MATPRRSLSSHWYDKCIFYRVTSTSRGKIRVDADKSLLAYLVRAKKITAVKAREIEHLGAAESLSAIQALVARGDLTEEEIANALAVGLRLPLIKLDRVTFDEQIAAFVKDELAARCTFVPVRKEGDFLILAMANPFDQEGVRTVEFASGLRVRRAIAPQS